MADSHFQKQKDAVEQAIAFAEAALEVCDRQGFIFAAIDISSALDKLKLIKDQAPGK
ncbi:hypothetical protein [Porphyrobacter sp. AAP60]|uniref:hypothetical protein n=1 Tax=Porphyrobacter sp. AAP60 TaxID=1523423 RepID=UPI0012E25482|nr:hypothetical protein [Porphyrobacter sp. AAP60]